MIVTLIRLAVVAFAPAPYRDGLFERLAAEFELAVYYLHPPDGLRGWTSSAANYPAETVPCWTPESGYGLPILGAVNPSLTARLGRFRPDCLVIYGHAYWSHFSAIRWARRRGIPYFLRCDSNPFTMEIKDDGSPVRLRGVKRMILKRIAAGAAGALTIGQANDRYWELAGVPAERRFQAPMAVDNDFFRVERRRRSAERTLLFVGRFIPKKNLETLLRAWRRVRPSAKLLLVGDGPLRRRLEALAIDTVTFASFQTQAELPGIYSRADALILPSISEPWGLVVNEAMAAGLPVFVSDRCGCAPDLVEDGVNGHVFAHDEDSIATAIDNFVRSTALESFGKASAERIAAWDYDTALAGFRKGLNAATS